MPTPNGISAKCKDESWVCERCDFLLGFGYVADGKVKMRMKLGEEVIHVLDPEQIVRECKRCGFQNELNKIAPPKHPTEEL